MPFNDKNRSRTNARVIQLYPISSFNYIRWEVLKDRVKADYGEYKEYYVNWVEQPGQNAFVCADGQKAKFGPIKDGECKKQTTELKGILRTEGIVSTSVYSGFEASSQVSVTQSSQFGVGLSVGLKIELPVVSMSFTASISQTVINTKSSSVRKTSQSAVQSTVRIKPVIGNQCYVRLHQESCSFTSDGSIPVSANGYIWFELNSKIKGRTRVGYNIENVLTLAQRSVPIPLSVSIDTKSHGDFESNCVCVDDKCKGLISADTLDAQGKEKNSTLVVPSDLIENDSRSIQGYVPDDNVGMTSVGQQSASEELDDAMTNHNALSQQEISDRDKKKAEEDTKSTRRRKRNYFDKFKKFFTNNTIVNTYNHVKKPNINADNANESYFKGLKEMFE